MNPLDWSGGAFLWAYVPFVVLLLLAAKAWQHYTLKQPTEEPPGSGPELEPYQVAVLGQRESRDGGGGGQHGDGGIG